MALDPRWSQLETNVFRLAPVVAADGERMAEFTGLVNDIRNEAKERSAKWDMSSDAVRERLYRLSSASRMAVEEVLLQNREAGFEVAAGCHAEPSQKTCTVFRGVVLHSGDILVSRGSAPTSALISRGNDFAGTFSHVSLVHVDPETGEACVIQALLEKGVVVTPMQEYERDRKLRLVVLRARADLPGIVAGAQLPHKAAASILEDALARHIAYDFTMDYRDHSAMFCSEVATAAYERFGVGLWKGKTHMSSPTLRAWLGSLGARHFETQALADLECDPQLRGVEGADRSVASSPG